MSLIKCKECGTEISSKAKECPKCGYEKIEKGNGCSTVIWLVFFVLLVATYIKYETYTNIEPSYSSTNTKISNELNNLNLGWLYSQSKDEMSNGDVYQAIVLSSNTVDLKFPYNGAQHGKLVIRTHPRLGKDVIFRIEKGQILCNSYDECSVMVKFDDHDAEKFLASGPADHSSDIIFIQDYQEFIQKMLNAKKVRVAVNIFQGGSPVFEFDVSNFQQDKYIPNKK